jgi:hypothetical protein
MIKAHRTEHDPPTLNQPILMAHAPCATSNGGPNTKKKSAKHNLKLLAHRLWSALIGMEEDGLLMHE